MPITLPNRDRIRDDSIAPRGRWNWGGLAFGTVFLVLLSLGWRGRQQARLQDRVNQIVVVCEELEHKLNGEEDQRWPNPNGALPDASVTSLSTARLGDILGRGLRDFDADYPARSLTPEQYSEMQLSRAVLDRAQGQFQRALDLLGTIGKEKSAPGPGSGRPAEYAMRVAEVRGAAYFGIREWKSALDCFRRIVEQRPLDLFARSRIVDCQLALGNASAAAADRTALITARTKIADDLLVRGNWDGAAREFEKGIEILQRDFKQNPTLETGRALAASFTGQGDTYLLQDRFEEAGAAYGKAVEVLSTGNEEGRAPGPDLLSASLLDRGNALFLRHQPADAEQDYARALDRLRRLAQEKEDGDLAEQLAVALRSRGNAQLAQQKWKEALADYQEAVELQARLVGQERFSFVSSELALSLNNRGAILRENHDLTAALRDFDAAAATLTPRVDRVAEPSRQGSHSTISLEVLIGSTQRSMDVLTRTYVTESGARGEAAVALAFVLRNRAYAQIEQGQIKAAVEDFSDSVARWRGLFERGGQMDLGPQLARTLSALAWIHATTADPSLRDGVAARAEAEEACALTAEKVYVPLDVLAAACAAIGDFRNAIQWENRALAVAPSRQKGPLQERLALYEAGKPYQIAKGAVVVP